MLYLCLWWYYCVRVLESEHLILVRWWLLQFFWLDRVDEVGFVGSLWNRVSEALLGDQAIKVVAERAWVLSKAHLRLLLIHVCRRDHRLIGIELQGTLHWQLVVNFGLIKEAFGAFKRRLWHLLTGFDSSTVVSLPHLHVHRFGQLAILHRWLSSLRQHISKLVIWDDLLWDRITVWLDTALILHFLSLLQFY